MKRYMQILFVLVLGTIALLINTTTKRSHPERIVPESPELAALLNTEVRTVAPLAQADETVEPTNSAAAQSPGIVVTGKGVSVQFEK